MNEAIFNKSDICIIQPELLKVLKKNAVTAPKRRFRYCLHKSHKDVVQEMIIAFCKDSKVPIHRHTGNSSESFHVIEGKLKVVLYDDYANLDQKIPMSSPGNGRPWLYRLSCSFWHTLELESEFVIIHEVGTGPFDPNAQDFPPNIFKEKGLYP